jgi:MFS family permease
LQDRRFLPLFVTQALGALNDNIFRNALIVLATFGISNETSSSAGEPAAIATGLFTLPCFLLSTLAGQFADRFDKARVIRHLKLWEIVLCATGAAGFALQSLELLLFVLFMLGTQSTFFSPVKFAMLPQHLRSHELIGGNAFIEAGTFVAILVGSVVGSLLIDPGNLGLSISLIMMAAAIVGYASARAIPPAPSADPDMRIDLNFFTQTWRILTFTAQNAGVLWGILGIAWFWTIGALFVSQFAPFTRTAIGGDQTTVAAYLALFSIGIGIGSLVCNLLLKARISTRLVPASAIAVSAAATDIWYVTRDAAPSGGLTSGAETLSTPSGLHVGIAIMALAAAMGIFSVPLYALVQRASDAATRSRTFAAANIIIAAAMVAGATVTTSLLRQGLRSQDVFALAAIANLAVLAVLCWKLRAYAN